MTSLVPANAQDMADAEVGSEAEAPGAPFALPFVR